MAVTNPISILYEVANKAASYFEKTTSMLRDVDRDRAEECGRRMINVIDGTRLAVGGVAIAYVAIKAAEELCGGDLDCVAFTVYSAFAASVDPEIVAAIDNDPVLRVDVSERLRATVEDIMRSTANNLRAIIDTAIKLREAVEGYAPGEVLLAAMSVLMSAVSSAVPNEIDAAVVMLSFAVFAGIVVTGKLASDTEKLERELGRSMGIM